jgi:flavin-dependent dehydrogenase
MTVLIAGGGIGGLTLALSLHRIGVAAKVFESVPELKPLGVGINVLSDPDDARLRPGIAGPQGRARSPCA